MTYRRMAGSRSPEHCKASGQGTSKNYAHLHVFTVRGEPMILSESRNYYCLCREIPTPYITTEFFLYHGLRTLVRSLPTTCYSRICIGLRVLKQRRGLD